MVQATADPMAQTQEAWSIRSRNTYLVVYQYALGARLYLLEQLDPKEVELLLQIHNHYTDEAHVRVVALIRAFPERYSARLLYDTAEQGSPPFVEGMPIVVLTGMR